jgi:hypothetical protein
MVYTVLEVNMFGQLDHQRKYIITVVNGSVDPVATAKAVEPLAHQTDEYKAILEQRKVVNEIRQEQERMRRAAKIVRRNSLAKRMPRTQRKLEDKFVEPYHELTQRLRVERNKLADLGRVYKELRRKMYSENVVMLPPGNCIPLDDAMLKRYRGLKDGQTMTADGKVVKNVTS